MYLMFKILLFIVQQCAALASPAPASTSTDAAVAAAVGGAASVEQAQLCARVRSPRGFIVFRWHHFCPRVVYAGVVAINKEMKHCLLFAKRAQTKINTNARSYGQHLIAATRRSVLSNF